MLLTRRRILALGGVAALSGPLARALFAQGAAPASALVPALRFDDERAFSPALVRQRARELSAKPYVPPAAAVPKAIRELSYDQLRDIRYRPEASLWRGAPLGVEARFFHLGHVFHVPVRINVVADGRARHLIFSPELFEYGPLVPKGLPTNDIGFAGLRVHGPLNSPDVLDEIVVFLGASYFRALGRGQVYGLSARGLAIATASPDGEEFPAFREFWIERPRGDAPSVVVHALLDSPSTTGAYRFTVRPGDTTMIDVEASLYPRVDIETAGLAPLTSMFLFAPHDRLGVDDFRPSVHDSDGLLMWNGQGEWLWRPLNNPETLQVSVFVDEQLHGFGLMQRARRFEDFQDLEARYERRPSLWVEPIGDWGPGSVVLVEIPAREEIHDNIVAFWRPQQPLRAGADVQLAYRLHWGAGVPLDNGLARVARTMVGRGMEKDFRLAVIDFVGGGLPDIDLGALRADVSASAGRLSAPVVQHNPQTGGVRVSFRFSAQRADAIDLRCVLVAGDARVSEVWIQRWST
jgi:glucans biosynthesis protein